MSSELESELRRLRAERAAALPAKTPRHEPVEPIFEARGNDVRHQVAVIVPQSIPRLSVAQGECSEDEVPCDDAAVIVERDGIPCRCRFTKSLLDSIIVPHQLTCRLCRSAKLLRATKAPRIAFPSPTRCAKRARPCLVCQFCRFLFLLFLREILSNQPAINPHPTCRPRGATDRKRTRPVSARSRSALLQYGACPCCLVGESRSLWFVVEARATVRLGRGHGRRF